MITIKVTLLKRAKQLNEGHMKRLKVLASIFFSLILLGCTTFHHRPIESHTYQTKPNISGPITPEKAVKLALLYNPQLKIERAKSNIKKSLLLSLGLLSNPQLSGDMQIPSGGNTSGATNGYDLGVSWDINKLFTSSIYKKARSEKLKEIELRLAWREWLTGEKAKLTDYKLIILKKQINEAENFDTLLKRYVTNSRKYVKNGLLPLKNFNSLIQDYLNIAGLVSKLKNQYTKEKALLKELIGCAQGKALKIKQVKVPNNVVLPKEGYLTNSIKSRLDIIAIKKAYKENEYMLKAAIREQFPDIVLSLTSSRDNSDLYTIVPGISISIPIFNHNQAKIAKLRAERVKLSEVYAYRILNSKINVQRIMKLIQENREMLRIVKQNKQRLENLLKEYKKAVKMGDGDIFTLLDTENRLFKTKVKLLSLKENYLTLLTALELETGRTFF